MLFTRCCLRSLLEHERAPVSQSWLTVNPLSVRLVYDESPCDCDMRYDLEDDPRAEAWALLGVIGPAAVAVRDDRAVRGVGALINDFLGVSFSCLLLLP